MTFFNERRLSVPYYLFLCTLTAFITLAFSNVQAQTSFAGKKIAPIIALLLFDEPEFSVSSAQVAEGDSGSKTVSIKVSLSSFVESSVDFSYPAGATATLNSDYTRPAAGTLSFSNGETEATISFEIMGDTIMEQNEFFIVELSNPVGVELISNSRSVVTIVDEDSVLNDTGTDYGAEIGTNGNNFGACTVTTTILEQQDCANGRDALHLAGNLTKLGSGPLGFDYTKLKMDGTPLANQNRAYDDSGSEAASTKWSCVRDNHTGLVWEVKESTGVHASTNEYRWGGLTAIGIDHPNRQGDYYNDWNVLVNSANNNARCGITDWRVPDLKSLATLINYGANRRPTTLSLSGPTINNEYFPFVTFDEFAYWSASPYNLNTTDAYGVRFRYGNDADLLRDDLNGVRLVSGRRLESIGHATAVANSINQEVFSYIDNTTPDSRYTLGNNNLTVVDSSTGLMWQRCAIGQSGATCNIGEPTESDWGSAILAAQSSTVGGFTDWRLPNIQELLSLSALDRRNPAINTSIFANSSNRRDYWSSTPSIASSASSSAWVLQESNGATDDNARITTTKIVRLVRGGQ